MKRTITFWFVGDVYMLRDERWLNVTERHGVEGIVARRRREHGGGRVWVPLDTASEVFVTRAMGNGNA